MARKNFVSTLIKVNATQKGVTFRFRTIEDGIARKSNPRPLRFELAVGEHAAFLITQLKGKFLVVATRKSSKSVHIDWPSRLGVKRIHDYRISSDHHNEWMLINRTAGVVHVKKL